MKHTPYGYDIIDGKAVVDEEKAKTIRRICVNYLSGKSFVNAAREEGLALNHCGVKRLIQNPRYLGDGFYPPIITKEMADAVEAERLKREKALGREGRKGKGDPEGTVCKKFSMKNVTMKYKNPAKQAEYAYSRIRSEV